MRIGVSGTFVHPATQSACMADAFEVMGHYVRRHEARFITGVPPMCKHMEGTLVPSVEVAKDVDVMIIFKHIPPNELRAIKKHCKTYWWYMDWFNNVNGKLIEVIRECDYASATGWQTAQSISKKYGVNVHHVLDAADPKFYYPDKNIKKEYDVVFIGNKDPERVKILNALQGAGINVKFFGPGFTKMEWPHTGDFRRICNSGKIVLNISRGNEEGYSSNRLWYVLACGSAVMTKRIPCMSRHMPIQTSLDISAFRNEEELIRKTKYLLEQDDFREKMAESGMIKTRLYRSWYNTAKEMLKVMGE